MHSIEQRKFKPPRQREKVLIAMHGDGFVEVFADKHVDACVVNVPYVPTRRGEQIADDNLHLMLPRCYRPLHSPGKLRAFEKHRKVTPEELHKRQDELAILRACDDLLGITQEAGQWE